MCTHTQACARARAHTYMCTYVYVHVDIYTYTYINNVCVCVIHIHIYSACVCVCPAGLCGLSCGTARPATGRRPRVRLRVPTVARPLGRRRDVDTRDRQRAVGCARRAHERGGRRRRDLRHRWLQPQHRLPQRRLEEHRWRCGRTGTRGVLVGY